MTVHLLSNDELAFPAPSRASAEGVLAVGGDLTPERLLLAYGQGIFPWPMPGLPLLWFCPDPRFVLEPHAMHIPRSLHKRMRQAPYEIKADTAFERVVHGCAKTTRFDQRGTWITPPMQDAYQELHRLGYAHSIESYREGQLMGGVYGVSLGTAFFGESMFTVEADASKIAFATLAAQLGQWGFSLIDCQVYTEHLERFGALPWPRERFLSSLKEAVAGPNRLGPWTLTETSPSASRWHRERASQYGPAQHQSNKTGRE